jgi:hypothetical protein
MARLLKTVLICALLFVSWVSALTEGEAVALESMRDNLSPNGWTGDPRTACSCSITQPDPALRCSWPGIECTAPADGDHVLAIRLVNMGITGTFPGENITGLNWLEEIDLSTNAISGTVPEQLGELMKLRYIYMIGNQFTGNVPDLCTRPLPTIVKIYFDNNRLSGPIPNDLSKCPLTDLSLQLNQLTGNIPASLLDMPSLVVLDLSQNSLSGQIPAFGNSRNLQVLDVGSNNLNGQIPSTIKNSMKLLEFIAAENQLTGAIPRNITTITTLQTLNLFDNQLSGGIPPAIGNLRGLQVLSLGTNPLGGDLPSSISQLTGLKELLIASAQLTGPLPDLTTLKALTLCDLRTNDFCCSPAIPEGHPCAYPAFAADCSPSCSGNAMAGATTGPATGPTTAGPTVTTGPAQGPATTTAARGPTTGAGQTTAGPATTSAQVTTQATTNSLTRSVTTGTTSSASSVSMSLAAFALVLVAFFMNL